MLSNAYFLAKFRFDTSENEPAKNLLKFCQAGEQGARAAGPGAEPGLRDPHPAEAEPPLHPQAARGYGWSNSGLGRSFL